MGISKPTNLLLSHPLSMLGRGNTVGVTHTTRSAKNHQTCKCYVQDSKGNADQINL
jgi:hypothetical protein